MPRDSSGNYTSPSADFVTGTTISSSVMNGKLDDLGDEITDSLSRSGEGGMLARMRGVDGTTAAPAYSFTSETDLGLYRAGSGDLRAADGSTDILTLTTSAVTSKSALVAEKGATVTNSTSNGAGTTTTGNGTGAGVLGTGGTSNAAGVRGVGGATNGPGLSGQGTGSGQGAVLVGGASAVGLTSTGGSGGAGGVDGFGTGSGAGVTGVGGPSDGTGIVGVGQGAGRGGTFSAGTAATGADPTNAVELTNGNLLLSGTAPNKDEALTNTLTPANITKAWANITTNGAGAVTLNDGFNVASVSLSGGDVVVTLAGDMANTTYAAHTEAFNSLTVRTNVAAKNVGSLNVNAGNVSTGADYDLSTNALTLDVTVIGRQ